MRAEFFRLFEYIKLGFAPGSNGGVSNKRLRASLRMAGGVGNPGVSMGSVAAATRLLGFSSITRLTLDFTGPTHQAGVNTTAGFGGAAAGI